MSEDKRRQNEADPERAPSLLGDVGYLLMKIILLALMVLIMFVFFFGIYRSGDDSMNPAVKDGDIVITWRLRKDYRFGDVIVLDHNGEKEIRRVVAVEGDTVDMTEEGMSINGYLQQEIGIYEEMLPYTEGIRYPVTVGKGEVFVLGDRREQAVDSRIYGTVQTKDTCGCVMTVIRQRGI